jgi:hypothetical protein
MATTTQNDLWDRVQRLEAELASTKGTDWTKMNRLELDLQESQRKVRELEEQLAHPPVKATFPRTCPACGEKL